MANFLCRLPLTFGFVINSVCSDVLNTNYFEPRAKKCESLVKVQTSVCTVCTLRDLRFGVMVRDRFAVFERDMH